MWEHLFCCRTAVENIPKLPPSGVSVMLAVVTSTLHPFKVNLGLPCPQRVVQLPDIAWEQYTSGLGDFEREFCDKKRKTRRLKLIFDKGLSVAWIFIYTKCSCRTVS